MVEEKIESKAGRDLGLLILFLIVMAIIWFAQGGPERVAREVYYEEPRNDFSFFSSPGQQYFQQSQDQQSSGVSAPVVYLNAYQARERDPQKEYIEIVNSDSRPLNITGWTISGKLGFGVKIPQVVSLYLANQINFLGDVILEPGGRAIILTGQSPLGVSFHVNKCSGYFTQSQEFYPYLSQECPYPRNENWPVNFSDACFDYIDTLPHCRANFTHPFYLENNCIEAIDNTLSYNRCVELHKNDEGFYKNEWRVYLGRNEELWKNQRETIVLKDANGNVVKEVSYK